jgi:hypothetical protein
MRKSAVTGAVLATAVAVMFTTNQSFAQEASPSSSHEAKIHCVGANGCKGKSAQHACKGQNACKGQGFVETSSVQECKDKGGKPLTM